MAGWGSRHAIRTSATPFARWTSVFRGLSTSTSARSCSYQSTSSTCSTGRTWMKSLPYTAFSISLTPSPDNRFRFPNTIRTASWTLLIQYSVVREPCSTRGSSSSPPHGFFSRSLALVAPGALTECLSLAQSGSNDPRLTRGREDGGVKPPLHAGRMARQEEPLASHVIAAEITESISHKLGGHSLAPGHIKIG